MRNDSPFYICSRCGMRTFIPAEIESRFCFRCRLLKDDRPAQAGPEGSTGFAPVASVVPIDSVQGRQRWLSLTEAGVQDTS